MEKRGAILLAANYSNRMGYAWNNIYRLFNVIAREFLSKGYPVIVSFSMIEGTVDKFDHELNIKFIEYAPNNRSHKNSVRLLKIIRQHNIRYVYFTDQRSIDYRYAFMRFAGVKRIVVHSRISVSDPNPAKYDDSINGFIKGLLGRWHLITADRVYAVSDFVRERLILKNRIPAHRVVKILNGIDVDSFKPSRSKENMSTKEPLRIFASGRATSQKGVHILIESAALLRCRTNIDFQVRYAGDGPELSSFRLMAQKYRLGDCFEFLGELDTTRKEVSAADIIVVPSIWGDACPSSVSEALASGKSLVATSVGGVPEIVGDDECAILVPPNDPEQLCHALEHLLSSAGLRIAMGARARRRAECALDQRLYHRAVIEQLEGDFTV